jgi:hypothetical protein
MSLPLPLLRTLQSGAAAEAWAAIFDHAWTLCSQPVSGKVKPDITARNRAVSTIDLFLATAGWELWAEYESAVPRTSDALAEWWAAQGDARAVLILDGLSLREAPWLLQGAGERGYTIHQARPTGAELPADTTPFANALGLSSRSVLGNNGAPAEHRLVGARTDTVDLPWEDCIDLITAHPSWVLWHHWPDKRVHDLDGHGKGTDLLTEEAAEKLCSDAFWGLVERMTTGRRLVITADHGYAASGRFPDVVDPDQVKYLKAQFKAGRYANDDGSQSAWVPPIDSVIESQHGRYRFVLGQRKWKAQGGYPTLTHGGLSVLEVAVPFIELSRLAGA